MDEWEKKKIEIGKWVPLITEDIGVDVIRDMYGFTIRPQHLQRYREYAAIYKEEEEERSERWKHFLETYVDSAQEPPLDLPSNEQQDKGVRKVQTWSQIRPSLSAIEQSLSFRKSRIISLAAHNATGNAINDPSPLKFDNPTRSNLDAPEEDSEEEFYDVERSDSVQDVFSNDSSNGASAASSFSPGRESCTWIEELECLVQGGVPMALRGELWQAFVGTNTRRVEGHYTALLAEGGDYEGGDGLSSNAKNPSLSKASIVEKWTSQIEKDLPRTFPGHPALDEDGRNALRRLLTAYARHNPSVGYCQAMNFFAGLLLLLMPEENAFWTLTSIIEDYFDGYYSEEMVEAQVDQLVFEELVQGYFPKLATHLDNLGVQVALVTGPWFLSIFVNVLPWESVLRVWDVLLYERNQTMLFRTALALMDLHGPVLLTTKDAGDAVASLQSLASATFDSSQLVLIACTGYQAVDDTRLHELRVKHRPQVLAAIHERSMELHMQRNSRDATSKFYSYDPKEEATTVKGNILEFTKQSHEAGTDDNVLCNCETGVDSNCLQSGSFKQTDANDLTNGLVDIGAENSIEDLQEQVKWLKIELCRALEEKKAATNRAEELEIALVEIVKADNRRLLSAKVEQLESELANSKQAIVDKEDHEQAMLQVMMQLEQEQRRAEDARRLAEQDALAQRHAANVLQEKYEEAVNLLATMEKRAVMAESTLEATLQSQTNQVTSLKILPDSPSVQEEPSNLALLHTSSQRNMEIPQELPVRRKSLLSRPFSFGWRDRNKGKSESADLDALLSPTQHNSGRKQETDFTEHANFQLLHKDTDDVSETHHSEKVAL